MNRVISLFFVFLCLSFSCPKNGVSNEFFANDSIAKGNNFNGKKDDKVQEYIRMLVDQTTFGKPWIAQKEIAAWSATVLYLSILWILFLKIDKIKPKKWFFLVFILPLLYLFCLFIHQQYGSMVNDLAMKRLYNQLAYQANEGSLPEGIRLPLDNILDLPDTLQALYEEQVQGLRSYPIYTKPFLPLLHFLYSINWYDKKATTLEMSESIQYDIMVIITISFIILLMSEKSINNSHWNLYYKWKYLKYKRKLKS